MLLVLLLFLTIPVVSSAAPTCPEGFTYFKRTPTAKNNQTAHWCLGVFKTEGMGDRDRARSICNHFGAMLSIPENKKEFEAISKMFKDQNLFEPHAIDGEVPSRCKALFFKARADGTSFDPLTIKGECNIKNRWFVFDDINSDPTFIFKRLEYGPIYGYNSHPDEYQDPTAVQRPLFRYMGQCMALINTNYKGTKTDFGIAYPQYCLAPDAFKLSTGATTMIMNSVLCGRPPL